MLSAEIYLALKAFRDHPDCVTEDMRKWELYLIDSKFLKRKLHSDWCLPNPSNEGHAYTVTPLGNAALSEFADQFYNEERRKAEKKRDVRREWLIFFLGLFSGVLFDHIDDIVEFVHSLFQ